MKYYNFIVSGSLTARIKAKSQMEAEDDLIEWLEDNSPVRNWDVYEDGEGKHRFDSVDIDIPRKEVRKICLK